MAELTNQNFKWVGMSLDGKRQTGVISAASMKDAQATLRKRGIEVINLVPKGKVAAKGRKGRKKKIKLKDVTLFTRYLSTMLAAGLPILQALEIIGRDQPNPSMSELILNIKNEVSGGKTLAESFSKYPKQFSTLYCSLIKAGEKSGTLDKILNRLAVYLEKIETLRRKIRKAMIYPIAILSIGLIVSSVLLIFVVPQFQKIFGTFGAELPMFTLMIVHLSNFMRSYWWLFLLFVFGGIIMLRRGIKKNPKVRIFLDKYILKIYIIGPVLVKSIIARFTRTLSTTLEAGMPIIESMKTMEPLMGNQIYSNAVAKISDDVAGGNTLSVAMNNTGLFPNMVIQMIAVGEASGKLSDMLNKIADYYEDEVNAVVDNLSSLLEPLIMLILGVLVGGFVIAMYLPIFKLGSLF